MVVLDMVVLDESACCAIYAKQVFLSLLHTQQPSQQTIHFDFFMLHSTSASDIVICFGSLFQNW